MMDKITENMTAREIAETVDMSVTYWAGGETRYKINPKWDAENNTFGKFSAAEHAIVDAKHDEIVNAWIALERERKEAEESRKQAEAAGSCRESGSRQVACKIAG